MSGLTITFWGVRGSVPVSGPEFSKYGGHTSCYELEGGAKTRLIFDAGTGLHLRDSVRPEEQGSGLTFHVFITHYHWDHLLGLPFFRPLYDPTNRFIFYGHPYGDREVEDLITGGFSPPLFPISLADTASSKQYVNLTPRTRIEVAEASISTRLFHHPQGVTAYRIDVAGRSIVLATDVERSNPAGDEALEDFAAGADVLLHDAQFTPDEYQGHREWGHSSWLGAVETARRSGAGRLVLVSHDPSHTDTDLDRLVAAAREAFPATDSARERQQLTV